LLGLVTLGVAMPRTASANSEGTLAGLLSGTAFWGVIHGGLLLLSAVGVCVGFVASVMYLVQVRRLQNKMAPNQGVRMLSLERLEGMNRHAILWSFPLLTAGLVVGIAQQLHTSRLFEAWRSPKILSSIGLWIVFAILLYLRYAVRARGRQVALWTIFAFVLLLVALVSAHRFADTLPGGGL
jgi:ABC-type transport system involved in cytochrome c biogenesis permease subunit